MIYDVVAVICVVGMGLWLCGLVVWLVMSTLGFWR